MLRRLSFGASVLSLVWAAHGCATGAPAETTASSGSTGGGAAEGAGGAGGEGAGGGPSDAGPDGKEAGGEGPCTKAADCAFLTEPCNVGTCINGACVKTPAGDLGVCDDGLFCTVNDVCQDGKCAGGTPKLCPSPDNCHVGACDEEAKACIVDSGNNGAPCDDKNLCTGDGVCMNGACINGPPESEGLACDDGNACTTGEICAAGVCGGGSGPAVYFADDFHDNAKGWLFDPEWGIGPAQASSGSEVGADPATDHSLSADNGVAGVVIGGNASTTVHPFHYLTSPAFNTEVAAGPVSLGFYRWLNSDYDPAMHNSIDVWDGAKWVNLWTSGAFPGIEDAPPKGPGWTFIQHDLTPYKNAAMQIRFGFDVTLASALPVGSWNIDDVRVAAAVCP
jgi:hypothetical protein